MNLQYRSLLFGVLFMSLTTFVVHVLLYGVARGHPDGLESSLAHGMVVASAIGLSFAITVHIRMVLLHMIGLCVNMLVVRSKELLRQVGKDPEKDWVVDNKTWRYRVSLALWMISWYVIAWSILVLVYAGLCSYFVFAGVLAWNEFVSLSGIETMLPLAIIAGTIAALFLVGRLLVTWLLVRHAEMLLRRRQQEARLKQMSSPLNDLASVRRVPRWPVPMPIELLAS